MTMTGRFVDFGIRILLVVAPLLAVISSTFLTSRTPQTAPSPKHPPRNFVLRKSRHSGEFAMMGRSSLRRTDSRPFEIKGELDTDIADVEDDRTVTSPPASVSFDVLPSPCPEPYSELVSFAVALVARPLRC